MKNNLSIAERNKIVVENMHIVRIIARQYYIHSYLREDLEQEGYLGLIVAAEHYDFRDGIAFQSYATWWIRRYVENAIHRYGQVVSIPRHEVEVGQWHTEYIINELQNRTYTENKNGYSEGELERLEIVDSAIRSLSVREQMVIRYLYGIGVDVQTPEWVATHLQLSDVQLRQVKCRSLVQLRDAISRLSN